MLFVDQPVSNELPCPFFIEWEESEEKRFAMLCESGTFTSDNEQLEIMECIFSVDDPLRNQQSGRFYCRRKLGMLMTLPCRMLC